MLMRGREEDGVREINGFHLSKYRRRKERKSKY
jgi:hypothetical protein